MGRPAPSWQQQRLQPDVWRACPRQRARPWRQCQEPGGPKPDFSGNFRPAQRVVFGSGPPLLSSAECNPYQPNAGVTCSTAQHWQHGRSSGSSKHQKASPARCILRARKYECRPAPEEAAAAPAAPLPAARPPKLRVCCPGASSASASNFTTAACCSRSGLHVDQLQGGEAAAAWRQVEFAT